MVAKLDGITGWEKHLVHVHELGRSQSAVGTILLQKDKKTNYEYEATSYERVGVYDQYYVFLKNKIRSVLFRFMMKNQIQQVCTMQPC